MGKNPAPQQWLAKAGDVQMSKTNMHFSDGFPFLLARLAQVKGMPLAVPQNPHESSSSSKKTNHPNDGNPMTHLVGVTVHSMDTLNSLAHASSRWMSDGAHEMSSTISSTTGSALEGALGVLDRQRVELVENAISLQEEGMRIIGSYIKSSMKDEMMGLMIVDQKKQRDG